MYARVGGTVFESPSAVDEARLAELQRSGVSFGQILAATSSIAS